MWSGRFKEPISKPVQRFTASVWFDKTLGFCDAKLLQAYNRVLWLFGIIRTKEHLLIEAGLDCLVHEMRLHCFAWVIQLEDVHRNIETRLTQLIGRPGRKIHTGKSRNDQVATVLRLWCRSKVNVVALALELALDNLVLLASTNVNTLFPGLTHSQIAQPITFGHYLLSYGEMLRRDVTRLQLSKRTAQALPLGCAALAGSNYSLNRLIVADMLDFRMVCKNSIDAVSDRDFVVECLFSLSLVMVHLSRLSEELVSWLGSVAKAIDVSDSYCTGSSIMPQKKNPDVLELIRGRCGRIVGNLVCILVTMKAQCLAYNKDNQEDKRITFEGVDTTLKSIKILRDILTEVTVSVSQAKGTASSSFSTATDLADYLVSQGLTFRDSHEATSRVVRASTTKSLEMTELSPRSLKGLVPFAVWSRLEGFWFLTAQNSVFGKNNAGGTSPKWTFRMLSVPNDQETEG